MTRTITRAVTAAEIEAGHLEITGNTGETAGQRLNVPIGEVRVEDAEGGEHLAVCDGSHLAGEIQDWYHAHGVASGAHIRVTLVEQQSDGEGVTVLLEVVSQPERSTNEQGPLAARMPTENARGQATSSAISPPRRGPESTQAALPLRQSVPARPQPCRDDLKTLEDWELWFQWAVRGVELLGELDVTESEYRSLGELIKQVILRMGAKKATRELAAKCPTALAGFLVAHGTYGFHQGDFWGGIRQRTSSPGGGDWGVVFETVLSDYGLPPFPGTGGFRFVTPILIHGGIPDYCLPDFFERVLMPSVTLARYEVLDPEDLVEALLERSGVRLFTDKPVTHFLTHGGKQALDFLQRCRMMALAFVDTGSVPEPEAVQLPRRVIEAFEKWAATQEVVKRDQRTGHHLRLRRPRVVLDPWGDGVVLVFPAQDLPGASAFRRSLVCQVTGDGQSIDSFSVRVRQIGAELRTDEVQRPLPRPFQAIEVRMTDDEKEVRLWRLRLCGASLPIMAFEPGSGWLVPWDTTLPADNLWLLHPPDLILDARIPCLERFEPQPGGWRAYPGGEYNLHGLDRITVTQGGREGEVILTATELGHRPRLEGGRTLIQDLDSRESALYVGNPPSLYLPRSGRGLTDEEQVARWRFEIRSPSEAAPMVDLQGRLNEYREAVECRPEGILLHLDSAHLLGPAAVGAYHLTARGPLGMDADFRFRVWPQIEIRGLDRVFLPAEGGSSDIEFRIGVPQGAIVEKQPGSEATQVCAESTDAEGLGWYLIRASGEAHQIPLILILPVTIGDSVRLPLRLAIPKIRWCLETEGLSAGQHEWVSRPIRQPLDPLLASIEDAALFVGLPSLEGGTAALGLQLIDDQDARVQQGRVHVMRDASRRSLRLPLGEFADSLRARSSTSFRLDLSLQEGTEAARSAHVATLIRCSDVRRPQLQRIGDGSLEQWSLRWEQDRPVKDQRVRLWHGWQPWKAPIDLAIPEDAPGQMRFSIEQGLLGPGRILAEFYVCDPWITGSDMPTRTASCQTPLLPIDLGKVEDRLTTLAEALEQRSRAFEAHYERACILEERGDCPAASEDICWCIENVGLAQPRVSLSMWDWLSDHKKADAREQLARALLHPVIAEQMSRRRSDASWRRYLDILDSMPEIPPDVAAVLLEARDETTWARAVHSLIGGGRESGVLEVLNARRQRRLTEDDAIMLLASNEDLSARVLEKSWQDPLAVALLRRVSPGLVVDRGHWVHTCAGWGKIEDMLNDDRLPCGAYVDGTEKPILRVRLRAGETGKEELAEIDLKAESVTFLGQASVWFCAKCRSFYSANQNWIVGRHDQAAHEGRGPAVDKLPRAQFALGFSRFDYRRPRRVWE